MTTTKNYLSGQDGNVWSDLPSPLSDVFLQGVVSYLTVEEFIRLRRVNQRYFRLLDPATRNRILGNLLAQDANHLDPLTGQFLYTDQLPTIGPYSVEESLEEDALLVAQLRTAACRRRALVRLPNHKHDNQNYNSKHSDDDVLHQFRSRSILEIRTISAKYGLYLSPATYSTEFLCINLIQEDVYLYLIHPNGYLFPETERILSGISNQDSMQLRSFVHHSNDLNQDGDTQPKPNMCILNTPIYHSFALCHGRNERPFAIYQARRSWYRIGVGLDNGVMQIHAIAIHSNDHIKELHCESTWNIDPENAQTLRSYDIIQRQTGIALPHDDSRIESAGSSYIEEEEKPARELAKAFYGMNVPSFLEQLTRQPGDGLGRLLNARVGEAVFYEDQHRGNIHDSYF